MIRGSFYLNPFVLSWVFHVCAVSNEKELATYKWSPFLTNADILILYNVDISSLDVFFISVTPIPYVSYYGLDCSKPPFDFTHEPDTAVRTEIIRKGFMDAFLRQTEKKGDCEVSSPDPGGGSKVRRDARLHLVCLVPEHI